MEPEEQRHPPDDTSFFEARLSETLGASYNIDLRDMPWQGTIYIQAEVNGVRAGVATSAEIFIQAEEFNAFCDELRLTILQEIADRADRQVS